MVARLLTPIDLHGERVYSRRRVALAYVRGGSRGLLVDLVCRAPWDRMTGLPGVSYGSLSRLLLVLYARAAALTEVHGRPRFLSPSHRVLVLVMLSLIGLHWYACALFAIGKALTDAKRPSWLDASSFELPAEQWSTPVAYLHAFDRALLTLLANGPRLGWSPMSPNDPQCDLDDHECTFDDA